MGDILILALTVEETFGVEIPDAEAEQIGTAGELEAWLLPHLRARQMPVESLPCLNVVAFNRARRVLGRVLANGELLRRQTPLDSALPSLRAGDQRRILWEGLRANLPGLPSLELSKRSQEARDGLLLFGLLFSPIGALLLGAIFEPMRFWMVIGGALYAALFVAATTAVIKLTKPMKLHAPLQTVGEVAEYAVTHNYWKLAEERGAWNESEVWRVLQKLIAREAEISPGEVRRNSSWDELGIGDY